MKISTILSAITLLSYTIFIGLLVITAFGSVWSYVVAALWVIVCVLSMCTDYRTIDKELHNPVYRSTIWINLITFGAALSLTFIIPQSWILALPIMVGSLVDSLYLFLDYRRRKLNFKAIVKIERNPSVFSLLGLPLSNSYILFYYLTQFYKKKTKKASQHEFDEIYEQSFLKQ